MAQQVVQETKVTSEKWFERAKKVLPGGATRPFRAYDPYPFYSKNGKGSKLYDIEGSVYTDYWMAHGAKVLGHLHPAIVNAVKEQTELGFFFGTCNEYEVQLAEYVSELVPSVKMISFWNGGTEALLHSLKLARAFTKRDKIAKFEGHYHSVVEALYTGTGLYADIGNLEAGPAIAPDSAGHDSLSQKNTIVIPLHDYDSAYKFIKKRDLAAFFIELTTSATCIAEDKEKVKGLREVCDETDTLLVLDEAVTGFRFAAGGAQELYNLTPDLTVFGKGIGGGELPIGAVGGRSEIMELMNATKYPGNTGVHQGGTYDGNSLVMHSGVEAMKVYKEGSMFRRMNRLGDKLIKGLEEAVEETHAFARVTGLHSVVKIHFPKPGTNMNNVRELLTKVDYKTENRFFKYLLSKGICAFIPNVVHFYITYPHTEQEVDTLISTCRDFLKTVPKAS
jgi:glutamate-1-semialdehyde 2,1-aminomutase